MSFKSSISDLYHERTNYQIIPKMRIWFTVSAVLIVGSFLSVAFLGLNTSIEFKGGTSFETKIIGKAPSIDDVRDLLSEKDLGELKIQILNDDTVKITGRRLTQEEQESVLTKLSEYSSVDRADISISDVGPSWGKQLSKKAAQAILVFFAVVALYMIFRFEWSMSMASLLAMFHDIIVTVGIYSLFQFNVSPATVVAFLTILGFSLYDTVVVFDKIKENGRVWKKLKQVPYSEMVNSSLNQVLARSLNTSIVAVLPVVSLIVIGTFILGATALLDFSLALAVGLATGAYSSVFIATPLIVLIKRLANKGDNI